MRTKSESRWQNKDIAKKGWHTMIWLAERQCLINSLAFIFLGCYGIRWTRPAQEKSKEQVNKQRAQSIPRRCSGRMKQRPKAMMLFSKTQYSVLTFQQGPQLSDTHSVTPPYGESAFLIQSSALVIHNLMTCPMLWFRKKGFATLVSGGLLLMLLHQHLATIYP